MEQTKKKRTGLVAVLAALLLVIGGATAVFLTYFMPFDSEEISGEIQIADEETLVKALKSKKDCTIVVTDDIVVSREVVVNGNKTLSGGSIIMNMHRVGSGESVLAVSKGANLVLDGATVDGNGVVNCVSVKAGGSFEAVSGSLVYGYPYGLDVSGSANITDIKIDEALHTGINVAIFGEVNMLSGTISNNVYGIAVAEDGRMEIADGVSMVNSYASFVVNYGTMDISGGKYDGAGDNAIENWGTLFAKGTADKPIEICNGAKSALNSKNKSTLTAEHIKIYDMGWHGMCVEKNSTANLKDIYIENAGKSTLYVSSSKANIEDATIIGGAAYAVYGTKNAKVNLSNVTIKDTNHRGIMNEDSTLEAENLTIDGTAQHGVYAKGESVTNINNATISNPGVSAVAVAGGTATVTNTTIDSTTKEGISVGTAGKVKIENVTVSNAGNFGIANYGGTTEAANIEIYDSGKAGIRANSGASLTVKGATIKNSGAQAINIDGNSVAGIADCTVDKTKNAAVYIVNSTVTMKSSTVNNAGTYAIAVKDSKKEDGKKIHLDNITVTNAGEIGIGNINSYVLIANTTVNGTVKSGIYTQGADSITNMNQITVKNTGTCGFGFNGGKEITARNVTISNTKTEGIYVKSKAEVKRLDNVVINDPGTHGIKVEDATVKITVDKTYNPENTKDNGITINNPKSHGIRCDKGGVFSAVGVTIVNAQGQGISVENESKVTVDGCKIDTTKKAAVYIFDSNLTLKNATIDNAGTVAISAKECKKADDKKVQLSHVTINTTGNQGIANNNSYVLPQYIKITNSKQAGIYTEGADSVTNMNQIEIVDSGSCGFGFKAGEITARNVTIVTPKNEGIIVQAGANVKKLDNVTVTNPGTIGIDCQGGTTNITVDTAYNPENTAGNGITVENPGTYGINISKSATATVTGATVKNAGDRGISSAGALKLENSGVTIDGTKGYGVYLTVDASITGTGLTVKNTEKIGIFSEGASLNISELTLEKTAAQGIQLKGGEVTLSNITVKETGSAAVRVMSDAKVTLNGGTIYAYSYGVAADGTSHTTMTGVTVERADKDGKYTKNALVHLTGNAKLEITDTVIDGKYAAGVHEHAGRGVELKSEATFIMHSGTIRNNMAENGAGVAMIEGNSTAPVFTMNGGTITGNHATTNGGGLALSNGVFTLNEGAAITGNTAVKYGGGISMSGGKVEARPSFILNGGAFTGNTAAGGADMNCTGGSAKIKLGKALTDPIRVKPNTYADTRLMAEKYGDISDSDFESSMKQILVDSQDEENWVVLETGYLGKPVKVVATIGDTGYVSLEAAITAANETAEADTVAVLEDLTIADQIEITNDVTIVSNKALTITGAASVFKVAAGKSLTVNGTESAPITIVGDTADVIVSYGALHLRYVSISGGSKGINIQDGGYLEASHIQVSGTAGQAVYLTGADASGVVANFVLSETGSAAVRPMKGAKITLTDGTIYADTYGVAVDGSSEAVLTNVMVERTGKKSDALVNIAGNAKLEINGTTKIDGKGFAGHGVNVAASTATFIVNGGEITGNNAEGYADVVLVKGATIQLQQALTAAITVKPGEYTDGLAIAVKAGKISDADFASSMKLMNVLSGDDTVWFVDAEGKLAKAAAILDGVYYTSLNDALSAAAEGSTVTLCPNATVSATISITKTLTITADKAVTLTAADSLQSHLFSVTSGKLTVTGASKDAKITIQASKATLALVYTNGGDAELTNVNLLGNSASTVTNNAGRGIFNEAGKVTAKSVNIQNMVKGDGIYVKAGATLNLDNVTITAPGRYGIKTYGTVNIYNTIDAEHALTIQNSNDHAIDIGDAGFVNSALVDVPEDVYPILIDTTVKNSSIGILVRGGGSVDLSHFTVRNTQKQGVYFYYENSQSASGTLSDFAISNVGTNAVELKKSTATLINGTVSNAVVKDDNSTLTENNVTVQ